MKTTPTLALAVASALLPALAGAAPPTPRPARPLPPARRPAPIVPRLWDTDPDHMDRMVIGYGPAKDPNRWDRMVIGFGLDLGRMDPMNTARVLRRPAPSLIAPPKR